MKRFPKRAAFLLPPIFILGLIGILNWNSASYFIIKKTIQFYAGRNHIVLDLGSIGGRLFSETTVQNISLRQEKGQAQTYDIRAQSITCSYNMWDLREGYEHFLQGLHCSAEDPSLTYDFRTETFAQFEEEFETLPIPAVLPSFDMNNGTIILTGSGWEVEIYEINAGLRSWEQVHTIELEVKSFQFNHEGYTKLDTDISSLLRYSENRLSVDSLELGDKEISGTGFLDLAQVHKGLTGFAGYFTFAESHLNVTGSIDNLFLKTHAIIENVDLGELQTRLGGTGWDISGKIRGEADLAYKLDSKEDLAGSFALEVQDGQVHGVYVDAVSCQGSFDKDIFSIATAEAKTPANHILVSDVSVPMDLLMEGDMLSITGGTRAKFGIDFADLAPLFQRIKVEDEVLPEVARPESLTMHGYLETGVLYLEEGGAVSSDSKLTIGRATIPIPATREAFESLPLDIKARFESSNLEGLAGMFGDFPLMGLVAADIMITGSIKEPNAAISLSGEDLGVKEMQLGSLTVQGDVQLRQESLGVIKSVDFSITELKQANESGTLALLSPAAGTWQQDNFSIAANFLVDGQGEAALVIARTPDKEIAGKFTSRNLDSEGWLGSFIDSRYFFHGAQIEAVFKNLPNNPQLQLAGTIDKAGAADVPFPLTGSFSLQSSPKGIEISEFTWKSQARNQLTISGFLPYDPMASEPFLKGDLSLQGHIDFPSLEDVAVFLEPWGIGKGSVVLDMDLTGSWNQPVGHILLQAEGMKPPDAMKRYLDSSADLRCDIIAQGDSIVLKSASLESPHYSARATGSWRHGLSVKELLQKRKTELKGEVTADATVQLRDLNFLRKTLPWLRRLEGDMQGEIHVAGPVSNPDLTGSFSLKDGEVSHTLNFPMLSGVNLQGGFDEQFITIENMQAEVGGSPVILNGTVNRDGEDVTVSFHVEGRNVLLFRNNDMRLRGDVRLKISGPLEGLDIQGTTGLTGGYYTRNFDFLSRIGSSSAPTSEGQSFLFSFPDPPLKDAVFDIKITAIEPFRIRNNLIRGALRPELSLKGTGELPFLVGTVYIDPSRVRLPSGRMQVQSGLLRFLTGEPDRPQLDIVAQSKVMGYDINIITRGPVDDPVITLSSSPSLPNDELLLLLLTGQPPKEDAAGGTKSSATTNVMVFLGRDFLDKWLEDESGVSDESILDRFELNYGRDVTKSGEQTVESSFRLSEQTTGTGKMYYLSGEKDKYDAYNYGLKMVFRFE